MRLVIISDTHGKHRKLAPLPKGDVLIHAGDLMSDSDRVTDVVDFSEWMGEQPFKHKLFVAGNHDMLFQRSEFTMVFHGMNYLEDNELIIHDPNSVTGRLHFWGSPWTPRPLSSKVNVSDWAFMGERGPAMKQYWDKIPEDIDVLITHGPPQGIMDYIPKYGPDLGCSELLAATQRIKPKLHIFGHIHHCYGQQIAGGIHFVNAAQANEPHRGDHYEIVNHPVVVDL